MDLVIFVSISLFIVILSIRASDTSSTGEKITDKIEDVTRQTKLNDAYYVDETAFCKMANALGFPGVK